MSIRTDTIKADSEALARRAALDSGTVKPILRQVYLHPGDLYVSPVPANVKIIVGSCVAVCLFDARLAIGGATHYLLPTHGSEGQSSPRYGDVAIATLLQELRKCGSRSQDLQAHLYGGACVLSAFSGGSREPIGEQNVRLANDTLSRAGIPVMRWETGGSKGRKITMRTDTGEITCGLIGS